MSFCYPSSIRERGGSDCSSSSSGSPIPPMSRAPTAAGNPFSRNPSTTTTMTSGGPNPFSRPKFTHCMFCKSNGEDSKFVNSHTLKDDYVIIFNHFIEFYIKHSSLFFKNILILSFKHFSVVIGFT